MTTSAAVSVTVSAPQVTITSPVNGSNAGSATNITGSFVGDPATTRVWVNSGNRSLLATINKANNTFAAYMPVEVGPNTISISVVRLDRTSSSASVSVVGQRPPEIAVLAPSNHLFQGPANVTLVVDALSLNGPISKVDFINASTGAILKSVATPPYQYTWVGAGNGSYRVLARAIDSAGLTASASIPFAVVTAGPPTVAITSPASNASFGAPANISVTATAATGDNKPPAVVFYRNGVQFGATNIAPYSATLTNLGSGNYTLTATATDSFGNTTTSAPVPVTVTGSSGAGFVQVTSPVNGASVVSPAPFNLAVAVPQNTLAVMYSRVDTGTNQEIGTATTAPFSFSWTMRTPGTYKVVAQAVVVMEGSTTPVTFTSDPITVTVKADPSGETITYLHNDIVGSPLAATDVNGALIWREDYQPYGERTHNSNEAAGNRQFYTGKPSDPETGLTYMNARYYDTQAGCFLSIDPVVTDTSTGSNFNRYAYANNNPYKFTDPDGRSAKLLRPFIKVLKNGGDVKGALKDSKTEIVDSVMTLLDSTASPVDRATAIFDLLSPVSAKEAKTGGGILLNSLQGALGEFDSVKSHGAAVAGRGVAVRLSNGKLTFVDVMKRDGTAVEVKTGNAQLSAGQKQYADDMANNRRVTPVGESARRAGFSPGEPIDAKFFEERR